MIFWLLFVFFGFSNDPIEINPVIFDSNAGVKIIIEDGWHIFSPIQINPSINYPLFEKNDKNITGKWSDPITLDTPFGKAGGYEKEAIIIFDLKHSKDLLINAKIPICSDTQCRMIQTTINFEKANFIEDPFKQTNHFSFGVILFAFIGGLVLNIMPCVLPVLSMKVLSLIKTSTENLKIHGFAFLSGVLITLLSLGSILLFLKGEGSAKGWGFHLQSPNFVIALIILFFILMLNMWRVFEFKGFSFYASHSNPYIKSFLEGVLIIFVSSPCSAPFMGTALSVALQSSGIAFLTIFIALGIGLATPMLMLCLFPMWHKYIPKSGHWMDTMKEIFGFSFLLTIIWLFWIFCSQTSVKSLFMIFNVLFCISVFLWSYGKFGLKSIKGGSTCFFAIIACAWILLPKKELEYKDYSTQLIESLKKEQKPFFLNFTAKWCLTCQTNKEFAIETKKVIKAFKDHEITYIVADMTNNSSEITNALLKYGRVSVPFYVFFDGEKTQYLKEILSEHEVLKIIKTVSKKPIL